MWVLRDTDGTLLGFGDGPFSPLPGQSQVEIQTPLESYAARFMLSADKSTLLADGQDSVAVTLHSNSGAASIDLQVNGLLVTVALQDGVGTLPPLSATIAGRILIEAADQTQYCRAGAGSLVIEAIVA